MAIGDPGQGGAVAGEPLVQLDYRHILASLADPVVAADATNRIVYVNHAAETLLGWPSGELVGQPSSVIQPPRLRAAHLAGFQRFVTTGKTRIMGRPARVAALHRDGTEIDVELTLSAVQLAGAGQPLIVASLRDLRERVDLEERFAFLAEASRILASSLDYETTLGNVAHLAVPYLADWCFVDVLQADGTVRRLAVAQPDDPTRVALAAELEARYPAEPAQDPALASVLRTGQPVMVSDIEESMLAEAARDQEHLRILMALGPESYMCVPLVAHGRTLGAISFVSGDPNRHYGPQDLERAEDLCRRAAIAVDNARLYAEVQQAVRDRDDFLSTVSHDLKNPLAAIKGQAQVLQRWATRVQGPEVERIQTGLQRIDTTAGRMTRLINGLVDAAHLRAGRPLELRREPTDLIGLVRQVAADQQQTTAQHAIRLETSLSSLVGNWDPTRLERVAGNLLSNAIKYSPDGGEIVVEVGQKDGEEGPLAEITVRDQGLGIPEDDLPQIFQRFYRGSNVVGRIEGTGIGLAGARQIVEQHGGAMTVQSQEGEGATFIVHLPLASHRSS